MVRSPKRTSAKERPSLIDFVRLIVQGDVKYVVKTLDRWPELATISLAAGATRQNASQFFFPEIASYVYAGDTSLHLAAAAAHLPIAELLIEHGANCRASNRRGAEPILYAATGHETAPQRQGAVIAYLVSLGADPNVCDKSGVAPLHRAVRSRATAAVRALLDVGADWRQRNPSGATPLHLAVQTTGASGSGSPDARQRQIEIVRLLLDRGAKLTDKDAQGKMVRDTLSSAWIRDAIASLQVD